MPLYMDIHRGVKGLTAAGAAKGHQKDLAVQGKRGVEYLHYWLNEAEGCWSSKTFPTSSSDLRWLLSDMSSN